jgi:putative ABC transport system permease protein
MTRLRELAARVLGSAGRRRSDRDLEAELRLHAQLAEEDGRHSRGVAQAMDALRDQRGLPWFAGLGRDVRLALRGVVTRPVFSAIAIVTLASGIAATAAVFAVVKSVLLTPLPYGDPDRLVSVVEFDGRSPAADTVSYATVGDWQQRTAAFEHLSIFSDFGVRFLLHERVEGLRGMRVSAGFFDTLGVPMYLGRPFQPDADMRHLTDELVLTYGAWRDLFGGDAAVVGRTIPTVGGSAVIVGVLPADFQPLHMSNPAELPRVFAPVGSLPDPHGCRAAPCRRVRAIGRLKPGVTSGAAQAALRATMPTLMREYPGEYAADASVRVTPLRDHLVGRFGNALWLLQAAVLFLLVLACANVAILLLARAIPRQREMAVRTALGAARWQLVRQLLVESAVLAATAGVIGVSAAWVAIRAIARTGTTNIPRIGELAPDATVLLFGVAAIVVTTLVFGLLPAMLDSRGSTSMLRIGPGSSGHRTHWTVVHGLIAGELALAFVIVLAVGLVGKSYWRVLRVDPGFDPANVLTVSLLPDGLRYPSQERRLAYFDAVAERVRAIPGVEQAGYASTLPLSHSYVAQLFVRERPLAAAAEAPTLNVYLASPGYLEAMAIRIVRGRGFTPQDGAAAEPVALVSESAARSYFAGEDPIGQHVRQSPDDDRPWAVVVGVVGDVHQYALDRQPDAAFYLPFAQVRPAQGFASLAVRAAVPVERIEAAVRAAMIAMDPQQPVFHMQPMGTFLSLSMAERSFTLVLLTVFGAIALTLAIAGVYGVVSYVVEQRHREVGLRLALGATPAGVGWMIVRQMLLAGAAGAAAGLLASTALTRTLTTLLFGVSPLDPATIGLVMAVLIAAALLASAVPVWRAARTDPAVALRAE